MEEISTRRPQRMIGMADELIARRQEIIRVILLVLLAAIATGFFTDILTNWIAGDPITIVQKVILIFSLVILIITIYFALRNYAGTITQKIHFEFMIPFKRDVAEMVIPSGEFYKPLAELKHRISLFLSSKSPEIADISKKWKETIEQNKKTIEDKNTISKLLKFLVDLGEFFIFDTLALFSNRSLSPKARYMPCGWVRPNYKSIALKQDKELMTLKNNLLFRHLPDQVPQSIKFLEGFKFNRKPMEKQVKSDAQYFEFIKRGYGALRFTISPFPIIMPSNSRDVNLMARYCGLLPEDLVIIKIPFLLTVDFRGFLMIRKKFAQLFAPWIEDLVDAINDNLDWQHCAQHDMERMVVELLGREV